MASRREKKLDTEFDLKSLKEKRRSVEATLNAVFESQLVKEAEKQKLIRKQIPEPERLLQLDKKSSKSKSMGDIKLNLESPKSIKDYAPKYREDKSPSGSSSRTSIENFSDDSEEKSGNQKFEDTVDRAKGKTSPSAVNVSVVTSTPLKNNMSRTDSGDIIVITGAGKIFKNIVDISFYSNEIMFIIKIKTLFLFLKAKIKKVMRIRGQTRPLRLG